MFADAEGPAGPRRRAELGAVAGYRRRLADRDGWLEFSLLAEDLPPMRYAALADTFQVSVVHEAMPPRDDELLPTARRWPRMLLTGLPGMGKSTALEQIGARWAADPSAPVPVLVSLLEIARRHPRRGSDITLDQLLEAAALRIPSVEQSPLRSVLNEAVARGEAVLLLDGLDECRELKGVVADGLMAIIADLPADTGVLLTTRDSGLAASGKLGLPQARLTEPTFLGVAAARLLRHAAQHRVPEPERDQWVEQRERWLADIRKDHGDLWRIPLLAMLFTLLAAGRDPGRLPGSRAQLLAEVVRDSVARWELVRPTATQGRQADFMRPKMLTDGFAEIGHMIARSGTCALGDARRAVVGMLASRWGLAPGEADASAGDVLSFWDDRVGVFVSVPPTGDIEARSRVFSEIGDAMWAARQDLGTQRAWVGAALASEDRREPLLLAVGLSDQLAEILATEALGAADGLAQALLLTADATHDGAVLAPPTMTALLTALVAMAGRPPAGRPGDYRDLPIEVDLRSYENLQAGPGDAAWPYVRRAAMLRLPDSLRDERRSLLAGLRLAEDQVAVAAALAALADAAADSRTALSASEAAAVRTFLETVIPADRHALLPGHITAAEQAIAHLPQLGPEAPGAIYHIARYGTVGGYERVRDQLTALGFTDAEAREANLGLALPDYLLRDLDDRWGFLFEAAAAVGPPGLLTAAERWRLPDLASFFDITDPLGATLVSIDAASTTDRERLSDWIRAIARAAGINLNRLAAQAADALAAEQAGDRAIADVTLAPPPLPPLPCDITRLGGDDITVLIEAIGAASEWLADVACVLLLTGRDPAIGQRVAERLPGMPAGRRRNAAIVMIANAPDPKEAAQRMLDSAEPPIRIAAAIAAKILAGRGGDDSWAPVIAGALADDDLTVRLACREDADRDGATYWSCARCAHVNDIEAFDCGACQRSLSQRDLRLPRLARLLGGSAVSVAETRA